MIKKKKNGELIVISGTTCAGKGTIVKELVKRNENLKVSEKKEKMKWMEKITFL